MKNSAKRGMAWVFACAMLISFSLIGFAQEQIVTVVEDPIESNSSQEVGMEALEEIHFDVLDEQVSTEVEQTEDTISEADSKTVEQAEEQAVQSLDDNLEATIPYGITTVVSSIVIRNKATGEAITDVSLDLYTSSAPQVQLEAQILPDGAYDDIIWASSNPNIAYIDAFGTVTGKAHGSATITASGYATGKKASITVSVANLVSSIFVVGVDEVGVSKTTTLSTIVEPPTVTNKSVQWTSSAPGIATVTATSESSASVRGVTVGTAVITATAIDGSGVKGTHTVNVKPSVTGILICVDGKPLSEKTLDLGDAPPVLRLECTTFPENAASQAHIYTSSDTSIAAIDQNGVVTGKQVGSAIVTVAATDGSGVRNTIKINVALAIKSMEIISFPVRGLSELGSGKQLQLDVLFTPVNATYRTFTWTSSNTNAATVNASGLVTAKSVTSVQQTIITATAKDGTGFTATYVLSVCPLVTQIGIKVDGTLRTNLSIDPSQIHFNPVLEAVVTPYNAGQTVKYSSWNTTVVSVTENGELVFTGSLGEATIVATAQDGSGITGKLIVNAVSFVKQADFNIDGPALLGSGLKSQLRIVKYVNGTPYQVNVPVSWSIKDKPSIAVISSTGLLEISPVVSAPCTISVIANAMDGSDVSATLNINITPVSKALGIFVGDNTVTSLQIADESYLYVNVYASPASASREVTWTTTNVQIAKVEDTGNGEAKITGISRGQAVLTATSKDGSGTRTAITVDVFPKTQKLSFSQGTEMELAMGKSFQLALVAVPDNVVTRNVEWVSDDETVLKVSNTGYVTAVVRPNANEAKTVGIYAIAKDGTSELAWINITVYANLMQSLHISLQPNGHSASTAWVSATNDIQMPINYLHHNLQLYAVINNGAQGSFGNVAWTSSNPSIATVENGLVTGVKNGAATITAKSMDGSNLSVNITVYVYGTIIESITMKNDALEIKRGNSKELSYTLDPKKPNSTSLTWTSSNTSIATVNALGTVVVKSDAKVGDKVIIYVKAVEGGATASTEITVK